MKTPATSLPWTTGLRNHVPQIFGDGRHVACMMTTRECDADADYIAHAANAYPRLIAALRDHVAFSPSSPTSDAARALLAELGEDQ